MQVGDERRSQRRRDIDHPLLERQRDLRWWGWAVEGTEVEQHLPGGVCGTAVVPPASAGAFLPLLAGQCEVGQVRFGELVQATAGLDQQPGDHLRGHPRRHPLAEPELAEADLTDLALACQQRQERTGRGWRHYRGAAHTARQVLFHLGALDSPAPPAQVPLPLEERMVDVAAPLRAAFIAYLQRKSATCRPKTVSSLATRLAHFGRFLADIDPELASLAALDRRRHIEPFITALVEATNTVTGEPITVFVASTRAVMN